MWQFQTNADKSLKYLSNMGTQPSLGGPVLPRLCDKDMLLAQFPHTWIGTDSCKKSLVPMNPSGWTVTHRQDTRKGELLVQCYCWCNKCPKLQCLCKIKLYMHLLYRIQHKNYIDIEKPRLDPWSLKFSWIQ